MATLTATARPIEKPTLGFVDALRLRLAKYRVFSQTRGELSMLSDRELNDIGIARSEINAIAMEAAEKVGQ